MKRKGFTLVELLVVMAIILVLMGLLLVAVNSVRDSGRRTQVGTEIAQLQMSASQFKSAMGAVPACSGGGPNGMFRLCSNYPQSWPETEYLKTIFPNMSFTDNGLRHPTANTPIDQNTPLYLDGNQAFFFFLTGGSEYTGYAGFSNSPTQPFKPPASVSEKRKGPWMEIDWKRFLADNGDDVGRFRDPWNTPYAVMGYLATSKRDNGTPYPPVSSNNVAPFKDSAGNFLNADTIQIVSAGKNKLFGPGGVFSPGTGAYSPGNPGEDDLANFKTGILGSDR